jgi:hypothetical protein
MAGIPLSPINNPPPFDAIPTKDDLEHALDGIELGLWDRTIVDWLARQDSPISVTVCSLLERARQAGRQSALLPVPTPKRKGSGRG